MEITRFIIHYGMHLLVPGIISYVFFKSQWKVAWALMLLTMLIDLDHLLAIPIFDPQRCSIAFHPFHSYPIVLIYLLMSYFKKTRILGIGLLLHIITDAIDCLWLS